MNLFIIICLSFLGNVAVGQNAGLEVTINIVEMQSFLKGLMEAHLANAIGDGSLDQLPTITGKNYTISNVKVVKYNFKAPIISTNSPNLLNIDQLKLSGSATASFTVSFLRSNGERTTVSGDISVTLEGFTFSQAIKLNIDKEGRLKLTAGNCASGIKGLTMVATNVGDLESSVNSALGVLSKSILKDNGKKICDVLEKYLNQNLDRLMEKMPVDVAFLFNTSLNVALLKPPTVTDKYINLSIQGRVFSPSANPNQKIPFDAPPLPATSSSTKMIRISISEYFCNTFLYALWQDNFFTETLSQEQIDEIMEKAIKPEMIAENLPDSYIDRPLRFNGSAPEAPSIQIKPSGLQFKGVFDSDIFVKLENGNMVKIGSGKINEIVNINIEMIDGSFSVKVTRDKSETVEGVSLETFEEFGKNYIKWIVSRIAGDLLAEETLQFVQPYGVQIKDIDAATKENALETTFNLELSEIQNS